MKMVSGLSGFRERISGVWQSPWLKASLCAPALLLLLIPLKDARPGNAKAAYDYA
jgi:hypothetical protein